MIYIGALSQYSKELFVPLIQHLHARQIYMYFFFQMRLQEYRSTNLNEMTLLGKVVKIFHHQSQQSRGVMYKYKYMYIYIEAKHMSRLASFSWFFRWHYVFCEITKNYFFSGEVCSKWKFKHLKKNLWSRGKTGILVFTGKLSSFP